MSRERLIALFVQSNLVSHIDAEEIALLFEHRKVQKGEFLLTNKKICNEYFFLEEGFMRAFAINPQHQEVTTAFYASGQLVFEVQSFFQRSVSKEFIQALTPCKGWAISFEQLNHLFHTMPAFREFGRHTLVKGFMQLKARVISMASETAEQRYQNLLQAQPTIFEHAPLKTIASYLGITDTSLSRIRKQVTKKP